jgi:MSHA biogenesis protein MshI
VGRADQQGRCRLDLRADPLSQLADAPGLLREQSRAVGLAETGCNLVLAPELYSVSLVERPPVPDAELAEAVRWRLQDNVDFPVDQAAIDVFPLPESASRQRDMVFVVALQRDSLKRLLDHVHGAGISVNTVDVTELALRNVSHGLYPEPDSSVGLLRFTAASGVINITRGEELFLSRRVSGIPSEFSESAWKEFNDRLLLQVQRSIDYYESAMSQPPCNALIVATTHGWQARVCEYLDEMLPVSVRPIESELSALFDVRLHNPEPQTLDWSTLTGQQRNALAAALPALGGLLRAADHEAVTVERAA